MHNVYLTLQEQRIAEELLLGDVEAVAEPFRALLDPQAVSWLAQEGAATFNSFQAHSRAVPSHHGHADATPPSELPFIPHLGALTLNAKAQVEHRAFGHYRGFTTWYGEARSASPTGVRLLPHQQELASQYRLGDTYASPQSATLSRRIHAEGSMDALVSEDESMWHVAFSVEPRQRITVTPLTDEAAAAVDGVRLAPRLYVHIYPYGAITATLGLSIIAEADRATSDMISLIRMLIGRRAVTRPVLATLAAGTAVAADLSELWTTLGPVLVGFFGG